MTDRDRRIALAAGLLLLVSALLSACESDGNPLANTEWRLVALGNADAPSEVVLGDPTAEFTTATDMTGGRAAVPTVRDTVCGGRTCALTS